ncbi:MAG TPA: chemotaxis protein CheW [Bdellovibrionota bacterium]|jgi:purine-binding chemotaxis protein CheW
MNDNLIPNIETKQTTEDLRYLAFSLGKEQYAIPLLQVKEVIAHTETTPVPYTPQYFKGIMNLRGQVISVIDLRLKFKMTTKENSRQTAFVILDLSPLSLGVVVDSVDTVLSLTKEEISPTPDVESSTPTDYVEGVARKDKKLVLLLNIAKTLSVEDLKALKRSQETKAA